MYRGSDIRRGDKGRRKVVVSVLLAIARSVTRDRLQKEGMTVPTGMLFQLQTRFLTEENEKIPSHHNRMPEDGDWEEKSVVDKGE